MNRYEVRYIFYIVALIWFITIIFIPLASEITIDNPLLRKTLISIPFLFIIIGKFISIVEKKKNSQASHKDWGINIGLAIATILYLLFAFLSEYIESETNGIIYLLDSGSFNRSLGLCNEYLSDKGLIALLYKTFP